MHDEEEDVFDPSNSTNSNRKGGNDGGEGNDTASEEDRWRDDQQQIIRQAKSTRATNRNSSSSSRTSRMTNDDEDDDMENDTGGRHPHHLPGEEEVDKHLSLVHDTDDNEELTEDQQLCDTTTKAQCPVEPFNLTAEREDGAGFFDGDTYVFRKRHVEGEEDAWMDDLDQSGGGGTNSTETTTTTKVRPMDGTIPYSRRATTKDRGGASSSGLEAAMTKEQIYEKFLPLLATDSETVIQALGRYGTILKMEQKQKKRNHKSNSTSQTTTNTTQNTSSSSSSSSSHMAFDQLTELSNFCMMNFEDGGNIYERSKEYFRTFLGHTTKRKQPTTTSYFNNNNNDNNTETTTSATDEAQQTTSKRTKVDDASKGDDNVHTNTETVVQWEYRGNQDNAIHGPYSTQQMVDWIGAGYFLGDMAVDVRRQVRTDTDKQQVLVATTTTEGGKEEVVHQQTKEDVIDDLLGDLDDDDDDDDDDDETEGTVLANSDEWMRSDVVNFSSYL